jgi:hypothetical protein
MEVDKGNSLAKVHHEEQVSENIMTEIASPILGA